LPGGEKQPYRLVLADFRPFAFAGLWERNDLLGVTSCTIITTTPNVVAAEIHDRMPAILREEEYDAWLSSEMVPEITPGPAAAVSRQDGGLRARGATSSVTPRPSESQPRRRAMPLTLPPPASGRTVVFMAPSF
jgi:putative SOS response-associated peptidase YedK